MNKLDVYAVRHKSEDIRKNSRSGGVFTALSDYVFSVGGVVYGCALDDSFFAYHLRATNAFERDKMRGSKYIQSRMGDCYKSLKSDLDSGKVVLFSGTSCQIDGARKFLGKYYSNLLLVDIVCHGVPSPKVWSSYLSWESKNNNVDSVDFRNKNKFGWRDHTASIYLKNGRVIHSKVWTALFYSHLILRPSCYECPYKSIHHPGDITIADYWGIEKAAPSMDDNKGTSLVLVNTDLGDYFFQKCKESIVFQSTRIEDSMQEPFISPFPKPKDRDEFWSFYNNYNFSKVAKKYGNYNMRSILKQQIKNIIK